MQDRAYHLVAAVFFAVSGILAVLGAVQVENDPLLQAFLIIMSWLATVIAVLNVVKGVASK